MGSNVVIKLPDITKVDRENSCDRVAKTSSWRAEDNKPIEYLIFKVDVEVNMTSRFSLNPEVFNRNPVAYELFDDVEKKTLEKYSGEHEDIAMKAFNYWVSILRWVADDYQIGRDKVIGIDSGWSTCLKNIDANSTFWIKTATLYSEGRSVLDLNHWDKAQEKLSDSENVPVYISIKQDAEDCYNRGDYRRSLIDMAISCETFLRCSVIQSLPDKLGVEFATYIEEANINKYVSQFFKSLVVDELTDEYQKLKKDLSSLFSKRNNLMHMGNAEGISKEKCKKYLEATNKLLSYEMRQACS